MEEHDQPQPFLISTTAPGSPDLDLSSVSSGDSSATGNISWHQSDDEEDDEEDEDSFISCTLHSIDTQGFNEDYEENHIDENDLPWDENRIPPNHRAQSTVIDDVLYPQQSEPSDLAEVATQSKRQLTGEHRRRILQLQSGCIDKVQSSCDQTSLLSVYAGCYTDDSAFGDIMMCNLCSFWQSSNELCQQILIQDMVTVAVEATAICPMDLQMRQCDSENRNDVDVPSPIPAGSNFVGLVQHCSSDSMARYGFEKGDRVASLIQWGGNARLVKVPPSQLFTVPKSLDSADVASLLSSHLPAFQALHHGRSRPSRYSTSCLHGKRVLIAADGATLEVQALIRLAHYAGASEIYVVVPQSHHEVLRRHRVAALSSDDDPSDLLSVVQGIMDLVVDYAFPRNFAAMKASLARKGRLICIPQPKRQLQVFSDWAPPSPIKLNNMIEIYQLSLMKRATLFDFKEYVEQFRSLVLDDVAFLLSLLATRTIRPRVDRFVALVDVPDIHNEIRSNLPLTGAIICEPWKNARIGRTKLLDEVE